MDRDTFLTVLTAVKEGWEKCAVEYAPLVTPGSASDSFLTSARESPVSTSIAGTASAGLGGLSSAFTGLGHGLVPGALAGLGYGVAKHRPIAGTARGTVRGGLTGAGLYGGALGGGILGGTAGAVLGGGGSSDNQMMAMGLGALAGGVGGGVGGGMLGWRGADKLLGKKMKEKEDRHNPQFKTAQDPNLDAFTNAYSAMNAAQLKSDAFSDVKNIGLTGLGVGAAGRGLLGLVHLLRSNREKKTRSGPTSLPLPFPAMAKQAATPGEAVGDVVAGGGAALGGLGGGLAGYRYGPNALKPLFRGIPKNPRSLIAAGLASSLPGAAVGAGLGGVGGSSIARGLLGRSGHEGGTGLGNRLATSAGDPITGASTLAGAVGGGAAGVAPGLLAGSKIGGRGKLSAIMSLLSGLGAAGGAGAGALYGGRGGSEAGRWALGRGKEAGVMDFLGGADTASKSGIPWYGPAALTSGMAGLGVGWTGLSKLLEARRKKEMDTELEKAKGQFHDALVSQYDQPIKMHPKLLKSSADSVMTKVGEALDELWDKFQSAVVREEQHPPVKTALDLGDAAGKAVGGYGMYAGLSGLLTGAVVYDKIQKRSRRAILDKALQRRQRRKFMQSPTDIYATPEPITQPSPEPLQ